MDEQVISPQELQDDTRSRFPWWAWVMVVFALISGYALLTSAPVAQPEIFLHQIIVRVDLDVSGDRDRAKEKIARVRADAMRAGMSFAVLALREGESLTAKSNTPGEVGWIGRGIVPPSIEEVAFALEIDEISEVIEDAHGFRIIKISDKRGFSQD